MGLAGRKEKQRIGEDPRNTRWANDTSSPGYKLLAGMGWKPNTGLGGAAAKLGMVAGSSDPSSSVSATPGLGLGTVTSTGGVSTWKRMPTSVLPTAKSDTRGLGASLNATALSSFEVGSGAPAFVTAGKGKEELAKAKAARGGGLDDLFARLNGGLTSASTSGTSTPIVAGKGKAKADPTDEERAQRRAEKAARKALEGLAGTPKKNKKRKRVADAQDARVDVVVKVQDTVVAVPLPASSLDIPASINPRMASRARHLAAKRLAVSSNAAAMAEILGIAAPSSTPAAPSASLAPPPAFVTPASSQTAPIETSEVPPPKRKKKDKLKSRV